jgi:ACS family hexuronate transporter-like MFS transporter
VTTFTHGVITMALAGTGMGCISPSTTKAILEWFPPRERATAMGFKQTGLNIGGIVGAAALPLIALAVSWQYGFLAIGMLVIVIGIASFVLYREPPQGAGLQSSGPVLIPRKRPSALEVLRSKDIWLLFLAGTALVIIEFAAIAYFVLYFEESLLFDVVIAGIFLAIANGSGGFGKPLSGLISDLFFHGKRKTVFILMCGTILALCLVFAFLWPGSPVWLVVILSIIFGFVATGWAGIHLTLVGEFAGKELTGTASGVMSPFMAAGNIIGPPAFGYIVDSTGSYQMGWWFLAAVALIATVLVFFVREERKKI